MNDQSGSPPDEADPIGWIENLSFDIDAIGGDRPKDIEEAVQIAYDAQLEIDCPEERIRGFILAIPNLIVWFKKNYRKFPWRRTRDPWATLVAEILLQRTHATTVSKRYPGIVMQFPNPAAVHAASDEELFDAVESLGFGNKRTTTLRALATALVEDHDGSVPKDLSRLQELPRIGPYTARACLCFAFGEPLALIDRNVEIVMKRVFDYSSAKPGHKDESLYAFLDTLVPDDPELARAFNLAILDLRASVCTDPPDCSVCPLQSTCSYASLHGG